MRCISLRRKILFITPSLRQGGVEHSLITALKNLSFEKYDITLFIYTDMLDLLSLVPKNVKVIVGTDKTKYFRKPYSILLMIMQRIYYVLKLKDKAKKVEKLLSDYIHNVKVSYPSRKFFKTERFDVVVSYSLHIGTEMALKIKSDKYYVFMHSSDPNYHNHTAQRTFSKYDKIICVSNSVKEVHMSAYKEYSNKMIVLENYVDAESIIKKSLEDCSIENQSDIVLCTCGRLSHEKGFDIAVKSADILKKSGVDFKWYFIGDGSEKNKIQGLIDEYSLNENIVITGYVDNPFPYIKSCNIYVHPSYEEAQPLAILEAMVLHKPIVSTKTVGGMHILQNGAKGVLTEINGESLAEGIISLIENPELRHSFENQYTLEDNMKEKQIYIDKWNELLS